MERPADATRWQEGGATVRHAGPRPGSGTRAACSSGLGEIHWAALVKYAEAEHKMAFIRALTSPPGVLCCEGSIEGSPCPKAVFIVLNSLSVVE